MRTEEKVMETKEVVKEKVFCDLCGVAAKHGQWDYADWDWSDTEISVKIKYEAGSGYDGSGYGEKVVVDICPKCFKEVLIPFLIEKGVAINLKETDF